MDVSTGGGELEAASADMGGQRNVCVCGRGEDVVWASESLTRHVAGAMCDRRVPHSVPRGMIRWKPFQNDASRGALSQDPPPNGSCRGWGGTIPFLKRLPQSPRRRQLGTASILQNDSSIPSFKHDASARVGGARKGRCKPPGSREAVGLTPRPCILLISLRSHCPCVYEALCCWSRCGRFRHVASRGV